MSIKYMLYMPVMGLEPIRYRYRQILSLLRLPFRHTGLLDQYIIKNRTCARNL